MSTVTQGGRASPEWLIEILQCSVVLQSEPNHFGAVTSGQVIVRCMLIPLRRVSGANNRRPDKCPVNDIAFTSGNDTMDRSCDVFAPDSFEALDLTDTSCYWLPVYDATRSRYRGIIVSETGPGQFRRLGFAEFSWFPEVAENTHKQVIELI